MTFHGDASVEISDSNLDLEAIFSVLHDVAASGAETADKLILIVPSDLSGRYDGNAFPAGTPDIFHHLRNSAGNQATVEAAMSDEGYQEFRFFSVDIILPALYVAENVLLPMVIGWLSDWIDKHIRASSDNDRGIKVTSEVHFHQNGKLKHMKYEGPALTYENVMRQALRNEIAQCPPDGDGDDAASN